MNKRVILIFILTILVTNLVFAEELWNITERPRINSTSALSQDMPLPANIQNLVHTVFRMDKISYAELIVLIALVIGVFSVAGSIIALIPIKNRKLEDNKTLKLFLTLLVTVAAPLSGFIGFVVKSLFQLEKVFGGLDKTGIFKLIFLVVFIGLLVYVLRSVLSKIALKNLSKNL